jgi:adenine deaminase
MRTRSLTLTAITFGLAGASWAQTAIGPAEVVIRDVAVVDVEQGRLQPARDLIVRGTRIDRIVPSGGPAIPAKTAIDGRGKFVIPGLIDAPVRLAGFTPASLQRLLAAGVTTVQDVGTDPGRLNRWRRDLATGRLYAPRLAEGCGRAASGTPASATAPRRPDALHDVLAQAVAAGRTPAEALRAVTLDRARDVCRTGLASLTAGNPADLIVLTRNPLDDIRHTRAIDAVVFRGEVLTRAHLNMLAQGSLPAPTPAR